MKTRANSRFTLPALMLCLHCFGQMTGRAADSIPVVVTVDTTAVKNTVPADFEGLSFEEPTIVPDSRGRYYYDPHNTSLVNLLKLMGVKSLRFGGTSVDGNHYKISHTDIDNLFAFAKASDAKIIYSLRLRNYPGEDKQSQYNAEALDARYIMDHYASQLDCFCLGNEPNVFYPGYKPFVPDWTQLAGAVNAISPAAKFCGPSAWNTTEKSWLIPFAQQFGKQENVSYVTEHIYQSQAPKYKAPAGASPEEVARQEQLARAEMLAKSDFTHYYNALVPALQKEGLSYRIEETNSFSGGGVANASDAYSASLWGLNYQYWWAAHEAKGLNFHTGYHGADSKWPARYSVFDSSPTGEQTSLGLAYAMLAFKLGAAGRFIGAAVEKEVPGFNTNAYAILGRDGAVYITVINQEWGAAGRGAAVAIRAPSYLVAKVETMTLAQSAGDISFRPGKSPQGSITLGNASIDNRGGWSGHWSPAKAPDAHAVSLTVPAASAVIVRLSSSP